MKKIFFDALSSGLILGLFCGLLGFESLDTWSSIFVVASIITILANLYYYYISREGKIYIKDLILFAPVFLISSMFVYIMISGLLVAGV